MSEEKEKLPSIVLASDYNVCCMACESPIPRECVAANIDVRSPGQTRRVVKIKCEHCNRFWRVIQTLQENAWNTMRIEAIEDGKEIAGINARIDHLRGNPQIHIKRTAKAV